MCVSSTPLGGREPCAGWDGGQRWRLAEFKGLHGGGEGREWRGGQADAGKRLVPPFFFPPAERWVHPTHMSQSNRHTPGSHDQPPLKQKIFSAYAFSPLKANGPHVCA